MVVGTLSLVQKGQTSGFSGCSHTVDTVHCVTASTGLTFLPQIQCPHHHISLFQCVHWFDTKNNVPTPYTTIPLHCIHCILWFDLFAPKNNVPTTIHHYSTATVSTAYWFDLCPHHHIPLFYCILCTASSGLTFLHQRQCPHHHTPLFHCVLCPLHPLV